MHNTDRQSSKEIEIYASAHTHTQNNCRQLGLTKKGALDCCAWNTQDACDVIWAFKHTFSRYKERLSSEDSFSRVREPVGANGVLQSRS